MSVAPLGCKTCQRELVFDRYAPLKAPARGAYGVSWRCSTCDFMALDVCPVGPAIPDDSLCLNCGRPYEPGNQECPGCGVPREHVRTFLGVELLPENPIDTAKDLISRGLARRGMAVLNRVLLAEPTNVSAMMAKVSFLLCFGDHHDAIPVLERAVSVGAEAGVHVSLGFSLQEVGRHGEAIAAYRAALGSEKLSAEERAIASANLANSLRAIGTATPDEIEPLYGAAIRLTPGMATHYLNLSHYRSRSGRLGEALAAIDQGLVAAQSDSATVLLLVERVWLLCEANRPEAALAAAEEAIRRGASGHRITYLRGRALALVGRLEEAREAMKNVLVLAPTHQEAKRGLEMIENALRRH